jgi:hypothetical protein
MRIIRNFVEGELVKAGGERELATAQGGGALGHRCGVTRQRLHLGIGKRRWPNETQGVFE